ncbi:MAG: Na+/H+ antiporter subunit C [Candidatus Hydrogenedentes bacterium]|nr:Na+/H+ antiporter subunit C [Candidatus Hydrogenedentota bacterium]
MELVFAVVVGGLYAAGVFLILRRNVVKLILGLALLGHGANLLIFTAGGLTRGRAPLVPEGATVPLPDAADPLPQALILTAIVIGFGVLAFMLALVDRTHGEIPTDDLDELRSTDT